MKGSWSIHPADFQPYLDKVNALAEDLAGTMARVKYSDFMEAIGVEENAVLMHWFIRAAGQGLMLYAAVCYVHNISFPFRSKMTEERLLEHIHDADLQNKYAVADTIHELNMTNWQNYAEQVPALKELPEQILVQLFRETAITWALVYVYSFTIDGGRSLKQTSCKCSTQTFFAKPPSMYPYQHLDLLKPTIVVRTHHVRLHAHEFP